MDHWRFYIDSLHPADNQSAMKSKLEISDMAFKVGIKDHRIAPSRPPQAA